MRDTPRRDVTLLDLVDSILQRGAALSGDLTLAVADVDLVQVNLQALLASVETVRRLTPRAALPSGRVRGVPLPTSTGQAGAGAEHREPGTARTARTGTEPSRMPATRPSSRGPIPHGPRVTPRHEHHPPSTRVNTDPEDVGRGLVQLVLTLVELLRQLMERQAMYRMESDSLTEEQVERLGTTFLRLEERMEQLKAEFGLEQEDLNLRLGPLGDLM